MAVEGLKVASRRFLQLQRWILSAVNRPSPNGQLLSLNRTESWHLFNPVLASGVNYFHQDCAFLQDQNHRTTSNHRNDLVIRSPYPDIPIPDDISLPHLLLNQFPKYKTTIALVDGVTGQEMTYSELHTSVVKVTSALVKLGLRKGDVVNIFSPNCPQFAVATLAVGCAGAIFSAVNPSSTSAELTTALSHSRARFLVTIPALLPVARAAAEQCPRVEEIIVFGEADNCRPFSSLLDDDMTAFPENINFKPKDDLAALPFSSGTTGLPKAVMLSHYNLVANVFQIREEVVMDYKDCLLAVLPFFHIYGQMLVMFSGLFCGSKVVTVPNFQPASYLESIQKYRPTYLHIVPPLLMFLARHPHVLKFDLSSVKNVSVGAAPAPVNVTHELLDRFKNQFVVRQGYGLTEASPLTHCSDPEGNKYHTIGHAINSTRFKVVDLETRESLGPEKIGELCIQGPQVMIGYYGDEKATAETLVDGWLLTGDVGRYDEDGHVIIEDRIKELIKVKGYQVAPAELEAVLVTHPSVQDAAVIGIKDEKMGEAPKAFVVLKPDTKVTVDELKQYVAEKVAPYKKLVGGIEFRSEIPKSASGKILRRLLQTEVHPN